MTFLNSRACWTRGGLFVATLGWTGFCHAQTAVQAESSPATIEHIEAHVEHIREAQRAHGAERFLSSRQVRQTQKEALRQSPLDIGTLPSPQRQAVKGLLSTAEETELLDRLAKLVEDREHWSQPDADREDLLSMLEKVVGALDPKIMQVIEDRMPGIAVQPGSDVTTGDLFACASGAATFDVPLRQAMARRIADIVEAAASVGRIVELRENGSHQTWGTGFVVQIDGREPTVATACHVAEQFATRDGAPSGRAVLRKSLAGGRKKVFVEFGHENPVRFDQAFPITEVSFMPLVEGCDTAILRVEDPGQRLPAPLPLYEGPLQPSDRPMLVTIGFPAPTDAVDSYTDPTKRYFGCARASSPERTAKFVFGGIGYESTAREGYSEIPHSVPTTKGQSGSPVLRLSDGKPLEVLGIHVCCARTLQQPLDTSEPCMKRRAGSFQVAVGMRGVAALYRKHVEDLGPNARANPVTYTGP